MKTVFVCVGIPGAGQLATASELAAILKETPENTVSVFTRNIDVPKRYYDSNTGSMLQKRHEVYKWIQDAGDTDYAIVDIPFLTAFDRADFIDEIVQAAEKVGNKEMIIVAIYHERSYRYLYDKYNGDDEKMPKEKQMMLTRYVRRLQQPIREEGFDLIYRIGGKDSLNRDQLFKMMSKITDDPFWTVVNSESSEAADEKE